MFDHFSYSKIFGSTPRCPQPTQLPNVDLHLIPDLSKTTALGIFPCFGSGTRTGSMKITAGLLYAGCGQLL